MIALIRKYFVKTVSILLALLFVYAAMSKILDFEAFQVQLAQSPLLSAYAGVISFTILFVEIGVSILLLFRQTNRCGLFASAGLMAAFTLYIFLILNFSDFVPCSCGGILEKLGWTEHLIFNLVFFLLAILAIYFNAKTNGFKVRRELIFSVEMTILSCLLVVILFRSSEYIMQKDNNFTRRFLQHPVMEDKSLDLRVNSYYIAGVDNGKIYLGNKTAPLTFTVTDTALSVVNVMKGRLDNQDYSFRNLRLIVRSPFYYLYDGSVPIIYRGKIGDSLASTISYGDAFFNQLVVLDSMKFAIRTQRRSDKQFTLASLDLNSEKKLALKPEILQKQIDGVFDVDGFLNADHNGGFVYTYIYRNQHVVVDKDFKVSRRLTTIDTTSQAKIAVTKLSDGSNKMSAPPFSVNKGAFIMGDLILNHSNLKGRHEPSGSWRTSSIIDVYRTDQQKYLGSFYIRNKENASLSSMVAEGDYLFAIVGRTLVRHKIKAKNFN